MSRSLRVAGLISCALAVACNADVGRDPSVLPQTVITPGGNTTGALIISLPSGWTDKTLPWTTVFKAATPSKSQQVPLGVPIQLEPYPDYCVSIQGAKDCGINIVANQTVSYTLGAVHITYSADAVATSDPNASAKLVLTSSNDYEMVPAVPPDLSMLVVAGSYTVSFMAPTSSPDWPTPMAPSTVAVAQGQIVEWPLTIPEWRFRIHLIMPQRQYPDIWGGDTYRLDAVAGSMIMTTPQADVIARVQAVPAPNLHWTFTLWVFGVPLTLPVGAAGTQIDVPISRIDMDDVAYTKPDGTPGTVPGTWNAIRSGGAPGPTSDTWIELQSTDINNNPQTEQLFPTSFGVDVIAGTYTGNVYYKLSDVDGTDGYSYNVTF